MKRLIATILFLVTVVCCASNALAGEIDLSKMSREELQNLINRAQTELNIRYQTENVLPVLYEENGIKLYLTGENFVQHRADADLAYIGYIVENNTSYDLEISGKDGYVNDWDINTVPFYGEPKAGKKARDVFCLKLTPAGISELEDIETVEFTIEFYLGKSKYSFGIQPDYSKHIKMTIGNGFVIIE